VNLPGTGSVLGIDVGYSTRRPTTGFCCLWWDAERVNWTCANAGVDEDKRLAAFRKVTACHEQVGVLSVAVDGPLRPDLQCDGSRYRAAEALLSCGCFQKRGKPGQTNAGSGPRLHEEATKLAHFAKRHCRVDREAVVEAFPNMFLGVLCDEAAYPNKPTKKRKWTDSLYEPVEGKLRGIVAELLPGREIVGSFKLRDHEHIASFACALTALASAAGRYVAVGSHEDGFIVLPPFEYWGSGFGEAEPWAARVLRRGLTNVTGRFPGACVYRDRSRWLESAVLDLVQPVRTL
jgi:hypothetical protein